MTRTSVFYNCLPNSNVLVSGIGGNGASMAHSQLVRSMERILEEAHHSGELILTNRKLKEFPKTVTKYSLVDTVMADLSRNRFCEIPEEITSFSFLETLILYHNTIRSIPESVKHWTSLTYLDLRSNQLVVLPREICFLPLQVLLVSNNRLTVLPDELGRMDHLSDLEASYNQLTLLPARIGELRSLRSLSLRNNHLMYLPRELTCLMLVSLDVSNNRIASLPIEIRQMITLVELNLENNPLIFPPASLCVRGLVHVFKFLETQGAKDDKGSRIGGNYDGYTSLRRTARINLNGGVFESSKTTRHHVDSVYGTCDGIDKRWSQNIPNVNGKIDAPDYKITAKTPSLVDAERMVSSSKKISATDTEYLPKFKSTAVEQLSNTPSVMSQNINYEQSTLNNGSSPDREDGLLDICQRNVQSEKVDDKRFKTFSSIQTYREYKEALKQQRNLEVSNVYKFKDHQKMIYDLSEASIALNSPTASLNADENEIYFNRKDDSKMSTSNPIATYGLNMIKGPGNDVINVNDTGEECVALPQATNLSNNTKVILSHESLKQQRDDVETTIISHNENSYLKPRSPIKRLNGNSNGTSVSEILNSAKITPKVSLKSSVSTTNKLATTKTHRAVTWNHDIPPEKLSFTMRREFDRQREETELMTQLRSIIETRLKMTLPEDIASALTDGIILCHLANYVRPRSVISIHVPSPGISKLTMARCRRNVDNFLEACRKIGVDEELICSCVDIVSPKHEGSNTSTKNTNETLSHLLEAKECSSKISNPLAVSKTVSALLAMDLNPHHQHIRNLKQQYEFKLHLQKHEQLLRQQIFNPKYHYNFKFSYLIRNEKNHRNINENAYEHQLTATCTKEQMQQQAQGQHKSTLNLSAICHFDVTMLRNDKCAENNENTKENGIVNARRNNKFININNTNILKKHLNSTNVTDFFQHANLKTFQKIKLDLLSSEGVHTAEICSHNNHFLLQTIVETESETIEIGGDTYNIVNKQPALNEELQLKVKYRPSEMISNKYKLVNVSTIRKKYCKVDDSVANVPRCIDFLEHSTIAKSDIMPQNSITEIKSKSNNIYSIYRVMGVNERKPKNNVSLEQVSSFSLLLRHDSHVLTIILSCVFIVTFLLLVFLPLP